MSKIRYRVKRWGDIGPGDVCVLYSWRVPSLYVFQKELGPCHWHEGRQIRFSKADDVVIYRECIAPVDAEVLVLDPQHYDQFVSKLTKEERWAQIHAEYDQRGPKTYNGDDDAADD